MKSHPHTVQAHLLAEVIGVSFFTVVICLPADGQDSSQLSEITTMARTIRSDTVQSNGVVGPLQPDAGWEDVLGNTVPWGPFDFHINGSASLVYNDNIFVQGSNKTGDLITTISPELLIGTGDYIEKQENWLTLSYVPSFLIFANHPGDDSFDQNVRLGFEWRPANWVFGIRQSYQKASGAVIEVGERVTRDIYHTNLYAKYSLTEKTNFEVDAIQSVEAYPDPLLSFTTQTIGGTLGYGITPKINVGVGLTGGFLDVSGAPNQTYQQALLRGGYTPAEDCDVQGSVGAELREFQSGQKNKWNSFFSLQTTVRPWRDGRLLFDAYRRTESSIVAVDQNYVVTGCSAGLSQTFAERYSFDLNGGYNTSDYYATQANASTTSSFNYFFIRAGFDWSTTDQLSLGIFYQYQQSASSAAIAFDNNLTGFDMAYHF